MSTGCQGFIPDLCHGLAQHSWVTQTYLLIILGRKHIAPLDANDNSVDSLGTPTQPRVGGSDTTYTSYITTARCWLDFPIGYSKRRPRPQDRPRESTRTNPLSTGEQLRKPPDASMTAYISVHLAM